MQIVLLEQPFKVTKIKEIKMYVAGEMKYPWYSFSLKM